MAIQEITDRINDIQFDMVTLRFDCNLPKFEKIRNVNVYRIGFTQKISPMADLVKFSLRINKLLFPFMAFFKAVCLHRKNKYDAIWAMMAAYAGFAALFFKMTHPKVPYLLTLQEGDPIEYIKKKVRFVYSLFLRIFTKADFIQAISNYLADWARDMGAQNPIEVVPNGVDFNFFSKPILQETRVLIRRNEKFDSFTDSDKIIITTSRLVKKNAIDDIIRSLKYLDNSYNLLILGKGEERDHLEDLALELKVRSRVHFKDFIPHSVMPDYLKSSDIFIRPSLSEGLGNSFLEAMAAGIPVIATSVGGIPDFLKDGEMGLFCEVRNPKSISEKVKILLENKELVQKITANAKEMVAKNYDWDLIAEKMKNIFNKLCL